MEENDSPKTDQVGQFQGTSSQSEDAGRCEIYVEDDDDDVHVCRKCNMVFYDIQKYLEHKVKHDNFKVKYCRSDIDRRMIMPKLVQKVTVKKEPKTDTEAEPGDEEKENEKHKTKVRKTRKKLSDIHNQDLVITDKPVYVCSKCDKKFKREATLRRHMMYDHNEDSDADSEDMLDDDRDRDYKPSIDEIKEEMRAEPGSQEPATAEMDSLDRVIMAAQLMEAAEGNQSGVGPHVVVTGTSTDDLAGSPAKRQKLSEEERAARKYGCPVCANKFKEINVLKTHMLTHSEKREYMCVYEGCTYSFKTKGSLKRHVRRHTGERPYPCELCGRTFAESGALTRHLKSRTPCTRKTDNDLPRYGKKWTYTPNIPAATARPGSDKAQYSAASEQQGEGDTLEINKDTMIQQLPEMASSLGPAGEVGEEQLAGITTVVQVLEEALDTDQQKQFFELDHPEGVEIVISGAGEVEDDDLTEESMGQFVQSETEICGDYSTVCRVCHEEFLSVEGLKIHLRTHLADTACRCWLCHFISDNKEEFENHMFMHHHVQLKSNDPFTNLIPLEGETKEKENKDKNEIHRDAQIAVKQLLELPQEELDEKEGVSEVGNRLLYKCPVCMRSFRGSHYLKLHMRNHTGLRPHKCNECDKSFITKDTLNKHMSTHVDERNFKCGECGKLFKRLSHVREHIKIHSAVRPFPCTVCDKSFKTNNAMKVHLRTHTDILPYECQYCQRRFREKGSVLRHTRMHTGEKPHTCQYCGRGFAEHGTLNRHLKAKVSCTKTLQEIRDGTRPDDTDYTVLAEFSSVVADTQQYIIPSDEADTAEVETSLHTEEPEQAAEYVVVQTTEEGGPQVQNVEIVTDEAGEASLVESVQVTDDYVVITEPDGSGMKILDSKTGEIVAIVPITGVEEEPTQVESITMTEEGKIEAITMTSGMELQAAGSDVEAVPNIASLLADGTVLEQVIDAATVEQMERTIDMQAEQEEQATVIHELEGSHDGGEQGIVIQELDGGHDDGEQVNVIQELDSVQNDCEQVTIIQELESVQNNVEQASVIQELDSVENDGEQVNVIQELDSGEHDGRQVNVIQELEINEEHEELGQPQEVVEQVEQPS